LIPNGKVGGGKERHIGRRKEIVVSTENSTGGIGKTEIEKKSGANKGTRGNEENKRAMADVVSGTNARGGYLPREVRWGEKKQQKKQNLGNKNIRCRETGKQT